MYIAAQQGHAAVVDAFAHKMEAITLRQRAGWAPIHVAAAEGHWRCVTVLLDNNAFINTQTRDGETPVFLAAQNGQVEFVFLKDTWFQ